MLFSQGVTADVPARTLLGQPAGAGLKFNVSFLIKSAESAWCNNQAASLGLLRAGAQRAGAGQQLCALTNTGLQRPRAFVVHSPVGIS